MARMKGLGIISLVRLAKRLARDQGMVNPPKELGIEDTNVLKERILVSTWYPYEEFAKLLQGILKVLGKGDPRFLVDLGRRGAVMDLGNPFGSFCNQVEFEQFLRTLRHVWKAYSDTGDFSLLEFAPSRGKVALQNAPHVAQEHCTFLEGWIAGALEMVGAKNVSIAQEECSSRGGSACVFRVAWSLR
jgi:hypothetical protein